MVSASPTSASTSPRTLEHYKADAEYRAELMGYENEWSSDYDLENIKAIEQELKRRADKGELLSP